MSKGDTSFDLDGIRHVARRLDAAMDSYRAADPDEFLAAIMEYHKAAEYVNERLLDAHDRLRQGNRTDAINSLEAEPNVLDCLQELDAADEKMELWGETCEFLDVRRPVRLLSDLAEELSAEYDVKHQLATELRSHRLLALGGGSLVQRVTTLRRMLQLDPDNKYWETDLAEYEKHCQVSLQRELATLSRKLDDGVTPAIAARIEEVCSRLADAEWRDPVDAAIVRQSQVVLERVRTLHIREELANVGRLLRTCHELEDGRRAATLLAQWERLAGRIELSHEDSLSLDIDEARAWTNNLLEQQAAQEQVAAEVSALSAMCTQPVPWTPRAAIRRRDQLRAAHIALHASSARAGSVTEVAAWTAAANRKVLEIERGVRLFYGLTAAALVLMVIATATAASAVLRGFHRGGVITTLLADVERLTKEGRHEEVGPILDDSFSADPWLENHSQTRHLRDELDSKKKKVINAVKSIENEISRASDALAAAADDLKSFGGFKRIEPALFSARDAVEDQFTVIDRSIGDAQKKLSEVKGSSFVDSTEIANSISKARSRADQQRADFRRSISAIRDGEAERVREQIRELMGKSGGKAAISAAADEISAQIVTVERFTNKSETVLKSELAGVIKTSERGSVMSGLQRELDRASENGPIEFLQTLSAVRGRLPSEFADDAAAVIASKEGVEAAMAWSTLSQWWRPAVLGPRSAVAPWQSALQKALSTPLPYSEDGPFAKQIETVTECLQEIMKPVDEISDDLQPIEELLNSPVMQSDVVEVVIDDAPYYTTTAAALKRPSHFKDEQSFDDRTILVNKRIQNAVDQQQSAVARHVKLAEALRESLDKIRQDTVGFEDGVVDMVATVFDPPAQGGSPDVLLRIKMLTMLMDVARARTFFNDNPTVEKLADEISVKVGDVPWVLSRDAIKREDLLKNERTEADKILSKAGSWMKGISDAMKNKRDRLGRQPAFCRHLEYIGWADADGDSGISISGTPKTSPLSGRSGTIVLVISKKEEEIAWSLVDCGTLKNGKPSLRSVDHAMHGRPLFLDSPDVAGGQRKSLSP